MTQVRQSALDEARESFYAACAGLDRAFTDHGVMGSAPEPRRRWLAAWREYEAVCLAAVDFGEEAELTEYELALGRSRAHHLRKPKT